MDPACVTCVLLYTCKSQEKVSFEGHAKGFVTYLWVHSLHYYCLICAESTELTVWFALAEVLSLSTQFLRKILTSKLFFVYPLKES